MLYTPAVLVYATNHPETLPEEATDSQVMGPVHGYRPGEKKTQMLPQGRREYSLQRSLMKVTGSDLMKLLRMITTLSIIHNPTFWVAHDAYLSSQTPKRTVDRVQTVMRVNCRES